MTATSAATKARLTVVPRSALGERRSASAPGSSARWRDSRRPLSRRRRCWCRSPSAAGPAARDSAQRAAGAGEVPDLDRACGGGPPRERHAATLPRAQGQRRGRSRYEHAGAGLDDRAEQRVGAARRPQRVGAGSGRRRAEAITPVSRRTACTTALPRPLAGTLTPVSCPSRRPRLRPARGRAAAPRPLRGTPGAGDSARSASRRSYPRVAGREPVEPARPRRQGPAIAIETATPRAAGRASRCGVPGRPAAATPPTALWSRHLVGAAADRRPIARA